MEWDRTPLGPIERWPQSLTTALSLCLSSPDPICLLWGPEHTYLYNDAYAAIVGAKHPWALGRGGPEVWPESWETAIRPILERVETTGEPSRSDNLLLMLQRHGFDEECYFVFSCAPVRLEDGSVGGVFVTLAETTARWVGQRRLKALQELSATDPGHTTIAGAFELASRALTGHQSDVPFALFYALTGDQAHRVAGSGSAAALSAFPEEVALQGPPGLGLSLAEAMGPEGAPQLIDLSAPGPQLRSGPWPEPVRRALVMKIQQPGEAAPSGFLVAGISPRLRWDEEYRNFLLLLNHQVRNREIIT